MRPPQTTRPSLCIVVPYPPSLTETFIRAHVEKLPANVVMVHGWRPTIGTRFVLGFPSRTFHKLWRMISRTGLGWETSVAYRKAFEQYRVDVVLAEYGDTAVRCLDACRLAGVPLVAHFHGYDASNRGVLEEQANAYPLLFEQAAAIIAVSRHMERQLIALGAPARKVHYNPYGVDCAQFGGADPESAGPELIAVGRFTEKKAPQLTLRAFAAARRHCEPARLTMIGSGPLLRECQDLSRQLGMDGAVTFLQDQPHAVVQQQMRRARGFVQHSVVAPSGDSEGTPVSVIEAGASGLPVVATRHGGIPDVVLDGQTGFLVDEGDVETMAAQMVRFLQDPHLAGQMGSAARMHVEQHFASEQRLGTLWTIIEDARRNYLRTATTV